ncbi:MAG TPA: sugar ABC transporter substrate-binding protein, partial [Gemmatimonadaceae bacterium]|nr:sugar ABC transporter substrate-binding protein [Gemmatimonadaceae bacterium]
VEIRFWAMGREGEVVRELMPEFERRNPGIRVRVQQMPWTAAHEKMLTGFVGEATPDVSQLGNTWVPEFQMLGALEPLSQYVARSRVIDSTDYFRGIWLTNVVDDTLFGAPWYVDTRLIYYRRDLLARVGVTSPPKSWNEWRSAMEKVRRAGAAKYGILLPTNEWAQLTTLAIQAGSPILRDGGRHGDFRGAEFGRAFEFYTSLFRDSLAPVASSSQIANLYQEFARGTFAMFVSGPWQIGELKQRMPPGMQDAWAAMPIPGPDATQYPGLSLAGGSSIVIWRASPHKQESWKLIEYLSEPEVQAKFAQLTGSLPARESAWTLAKLDTSANMAVFREQLRRVAPTPMVPEWELIATRLFETSEQVVRGRMSETEARRSLDAEVDQILEKRRWLLDRQ